MPKEHTRTLRPVSRVGTAAMMAEAAGASFWVGDGRINVKSTNTKPPQKDAAANRIPTEIALRITKHLDVKDLGRAAVAWRPAALASHAAPEFLRLECARFSLLVGRLSSVSMRDVCDRMEQYNYAWSTLQFSIGNSFYIPETTINTVWAGSRDWQAGQNFMGESNGYMYEVRSWQAPDQQYQAMVTLYRVPSLRTGELDFNPVRFIVPLAAHFVKAVAVNPVEQVVAVLEFNNQTNSYLFVHLYDFTGRYLANHSIETWHTMSAEVYHFELHGDMICVMIQSSVAPSQSKILAVNWRGSPRAVYFRGGCDGEAYFSGFQFITEDIYIMTEKSKTARGDHIPSPVIRVGHVRKNLQFIVGLHDKYGDGLFPNNVTLIRNVSNYAPTAGAFYPNPALRLFGLKFDYRNYDGSMRSNVCLIGRTTIENWLQLPLTGPLEPLHWITLPTKNTIDPDYLRLQMAPYNPTNREGLSLIGRRLFWGELWPTGCGLNMLDFNPGAAAVTNKDKRGGMWESYTGNFTADPYTVTYTSTTRITNVDRIIPTEDALLIKQNSGGSGGAPNFMALLM
ncbi:hypothetical protein B0H10DRAFT_1938650 [Mycena sp. CBHHK59/15]|nr:hypothetical protein B0H10DRAFT_1938650 [Mycena sp. CBHHK59/15]